MDRFQLRCKRQRRADKLAWAAGPGKHSSRNERAEGPTHGRRPSSNRPCIYLFCHAIVTRVQQRSAQHLMPGFQPSVTIATSS